MTAVAHLQGTTSSSFNSGGNAYQPLASAQFTTGGSFSTTQARVTYRAAGVISKLWVNVILNTLNATTTLKLRNGGSNGNNSISIASSTTGLMEDSSSSDTIAAGDTIDCHFDTTGAGSGSATLKTISSLFAATTNTVTKLSCSGIRTYTGTQTAYHPLGGTIEGSNTTENRAEQYFGVAGTIKNLGVRVNSNSNSSANTVRTRVNGANGNCAVSVLATTNGVFEDTSNSDTIAVGDIACVQLALTAGSVSVDVTQTWTDFESTNGDGVMFWCKPASGMTVNSFDRFINIGGSLATVESTENNTRAKSNQAFTASRLSVYLSSNSINQTMSLYLRANNSSTALVASITASTSGRFTDTSNTASIVSGDYINYMVSSVGSGTSSWRSISMSAAYGAGASFTPADHYGMSGFYGA